MSYPAPAWRIRNSRVTGDKPKPQIRVSSPRAHVSLRHGRFRSSVFCLTLARDLAKTRTSLTETRASDKKFGRRQNPASYETHISRRCGHKRLGVTLPGNAGLDQHQGHPRCNLESTPLRPLACSQGLFSARRAHITYLVPFMNCFMANDLLSYGLTISLLPPQPMLAHHASSGFHSSVP